MPASRSRRAATATAAVLAGAAILTGGIAAARHGGPQCQIRQTAAGQPLPDRHCTPGIILTGVTATQVCTPGWASAHRNVPAAVRTAVLARYGNPPQLELGGTNDPANLWPEPGKIPNAKDTVENRLHRAVCSGRLDLKAAQREIADDWTRAEAA